jgi:hypothetical protein
VQRQHLPALDFRTEQADRFARVTKRGHQIFTRLLGMLFDFIQCPVAERIQNTATVIIPAAAESLSDTAYPVNRFARFISENSPSNFFSASPDWNKPGANDVNAWLNRPEVDQTDPAQ